MFLNQPQSKKLKLSVVVLALSGVFVPEQGGAATEKPVSKPALTVKVSTLQPFPVGRSITANGSIQAWQEALVSAEISGLRIVDVNVSVGDKVQRGDVLATLAAETIQASLDEARASLLENEALLADARANAERSRSLKASGFVSEQQASLSTTSEQTAQAKLEVQRARVQSAQLRLAQTRILAPDSGVISSATAAVGSLSQTGVELFRLIRKGQLEWRAELTAEELAQVRKGMAAEVSVSGGRVIKGMVRAIAPQVNPQTRYGYALVKLPQDAEVFAGTFARGSFDVGNGKKDAPTLPQSAVLQRGSMTYVLVVGADNHVHERPVTVGLRAGERIEIREGLKANESVVQSGGPFLTEGDIVQVVK